MKVRRPEFQVSSRSIRFLFGICVLLAVAVAGLASPGSAFAQSMALDPSPAQIGEAIRSRLTQAQLALAGDTEEARQLVEEARSAYAGDFSSALEAASPEAAGRIQDGFRGVESALGAGDAPAFAAWRAQIWTGLLDGSYAVVQSALQIGDGKTAQKWLSLREFRQATRFSRPGADATLAVDGLAKGTVTADEALVAVKADLLDTYQARLTEALHDIPTLDKQGFAMRRAEKAALASGYFAILAHAYREQRGDGALSQAQKAFDDLALRAHEGQKLDEALVLVDEALQGFRAAPLSEADRTRRAGQLLRYIALVSVEYGRGVHDGQVTRDIEIQEGITFRNGAAAAFADLQDLLDKRDPAKTAQVAELMSKLETQLAGAAAHREVAAPSEVAANVNQITGLLAEVMPEEWQRHDSSADLDVVGSVLDQMEKAVVAGQYEQAESARLEAYAVLESGPEAKLRAFAPELALKIEELFWFGPGEHKGLAFLIKEHAPLKDVKATRAALDKLLDEAGTIVKGNNEPVAVATNASIIVFREGLEAVLILASLMGSLKMGANRRFRKPIWWGAGLSFVAIVLTWMLAQGVLVAMARFGEKLEAVVSLIAIGVLLLITNWFFHKVYWTGWIASFHSQKKRLIGGEMGQILGLVILGFTSIYREGFESVLFLQALVLAAGMGAVLAGVAIGLAGTLLVGVVVFALQAKLPYKKMLVVTGVMIGVVLLMMVGNTAHILQVVGWLPIHPILGLDLPYWAGTWFGLFPTWEGIGLQVAAATFVIGSYFLAERQKHSRREPEASTPTPTKEDQVDLGAGSPLVAQRVIE